ncbi:hypothetical protein [Streptomyces flavalbus]|uniref:Secreted protein n=1 Tax=Streptomyces flavalbus TaxID=2665155 RepID=A0ABW2W972_9ACTN
MNVRLLALAGVAACAVALPLAMASAGPVDDRGQPPARPDRAAVRPSVPPGADDGEPDAKGAVPREPGEPGTPLTLGLGLATAARCGPELTSREGVEAQTCVLTQGAETWARTYYRNATGDALDAVLSLLGPEGRTVQLRCAVGAEDEPGVCDTPRDRGAGEPADYTAVAEFAARDGRGPLLLRSGSNVGNPDDADNSGSPTGG